MDRLVGQALVPVASFPEASADEEGAIRFTPALEQKSDALQRLASGSAVRIAFHMSERFWASDAFAKRHRADDLDTWSFLHGHGGRFPTWWTAYPSTAAVLVGWCGGPPAREIAQLPSCEIVDRALDSLAQHVGLSQRRLTSMVEATWMHDWERDPFARGAYSYQMVGGVEAPTALARPLRSTIFFAGEATETSGGTGTVHGAIATGRRAATQVLRALESG